MKQVNLPSPEAKHALKVLQFAVTEALDRKKKLGQYSVVLRDQPNKKTNTLRK